MFKDSFKLNAIAWKARAEGQSYGQYSCGLSEREKERIYEEYEQVMERKKERENARWGIRGYTNHKK